MTEDQKNGLYIGLFIALLIGVIIKQGMMIREAKHGNIQSDKNYQEVIGRLSKELEAAKEVNKHTQDSLDKELQKNHKQDRIIIHKYDTIYRNNNSLSADSAGRLLIHRLNQYKGFMR